MALRCRFYQRKFPAVDELVMVNVRSVTDKLAHVHLLQYNNLEGIILLSEVSRRRIRSMNKLLRLNTNQCLVVIKVDEQQGLVDLSKRRLSTPRDIATCEKTFARGKAVASLLQRVGSMLGFTDEEQLVDLMMKTAWYFDEKYEQSGGAYGAFKRATSDPSIIDECGLDERTKEVLLLSIKSRMGDFSKAVTIRSCIEVSCFNYEGIDAVKDALKEGLKLTHHELPLSITLLGSPLYNVTTSAHDVTEGLKYLDAVIGVIKNAIEERDGRFALIKCPTVDTEIEDESEDETEQHEIKKIEKDQKTDLFDGNSSDTGREDDSGNYSGENEWKHDHGEDKDAEVVDESCL